MALHIEVAKSCGMIADLLTDNAEVLALAKKHNANYILIDGQYEINIDLD